MSLNGLDTAKVNIAHERAVAESGGWYVGTAATRPLADLWLTLGFSFITFQETR